MAIVKFHCPFAGLSGCQDSSGNGLNKTYLITHLRDRHCKGEAQAITKHALLTGLVVFERTQVTFKRMGIWLCGVCFKTHTTHAKCRYRSDFVPPPDNGDGIVRFVLHDLIKPPVPSGSQLDHVGDLMHAELDGFTLSVLDRLFSKGLRTVKSIPPKCRLGFSRFLRVALDKVICKPDDVACWVSLLVLPLCLLKTFNPGTLRETLAESAPPMLDLDREDLDLTDRNLKQCKRKICDGHYTAAVRVLSSSGVAPYNDATLQELKTKHPFMSAPSLLDSHIDHHPLIASQDVVLDMIKSFPRGTSYGRDGLRAQHLMDCLNGAALAISDELVSSITQVVNLFLEGRCPTMLVWCWVPEGGEAILHAVNHLVEDHGDDVGLSMLLVDFQNAFNLSSATLALPDYTTESTPCGHAKGCSRAWNLDDGTIVGDTLVVGKVLELITEDGPRCGLHLNVDKTELFWTKEDPRSRLEGIFPPNISRPLHGVKLLGGPISVDVDFGSALVMKRVSNLVGVWGTGHWDSPITFAFGGLGVYSAGDVLNYAFIASRLQCAALQTKLLRHVGIVTSGSTFDDALCVFNNAMEIDFLSTPSEMALWQSEREEHTFDWLRVVSISGLGQTMNACSKVFTGDVYGDHAVSCAGVIGIKHRHNTVRDNFIDICSRSWILAGKEVDIGLVGDGDKALRPANMLLYSWKGGLDVCVDLTGSSPLTQTRMTDFVPGRVVIDAAQRKRGKYMTKCADIGYGFLPFSFSSFGELEKDAVTLRMPVRKFFRLKILGPALLFTFLIGLVFPLLKEWGPR
ncbi:hypothetical protein Tco_0665497 [Tanacetum coccineum]